jgi:serine/threonine protein phosphatase PrpC
MTKATTEEEEDERRATDENGCGSDVNGLIAIPLSTDQNPDSPGEKERILSSGGFVSPPPEPGLSSRVWLDRAHTQIGLAMARSIGDHAVKSVGVIARPVVTTRTIDWEADEFVIVATDGVWEFLSSEDAVNIVGRHLYGETAANDDGTGDSDADKDDAGDGSVGGGGLGASAACKALIKAASEKWHEHEGDYRDDITAIVVRLRDIWGR